MKVDISKIETRLFINNEFVNSLSGKVSEYVYCVGGVVPTIADLKNTNANITFSADL